MKQLVAFGLQGGVKIWKIPPLCYIVANCNIDIERRQTRADGRRNVAQAQKSRILTEKMQHRTLTLYVYKTISTKLKNCIDKRCKVYYNNSCQGQSLANILSVHCTEHKQRMRPLRRKKGATSCCTQLLSITRTARKYTQARTQPTLKRRTKTRNR